MLLFVNTVLNIDIIIICLLIRRDTKYVIVPTVIMLFSIILIILGFKFI